MTHHPRLFQPALVARPSVAVFAALLLALVAPSSVFAQEITISGNVLPNSVSTPNWDAGSELHVGYNSDGSLQINAGGSVSNISAYIGTEPGSTGTVTVDGGSWTNSFGISIGVQGTGTLNLNSGSISSESGSIADWSGSNGTVTVDGGSWTISNDLIVGHSGTGTLNISGGSVSNNSGTIGLLNGSDGTVTVDGGSWTISSSLDVGYSGTGTLNLNSGSVSSTSITIADSNDGVGTVTVNGGTLTSSDAIFIGDSAGTSSLNLNGGVVVASQVSNGTSTGTVTFNGGTLRLNGSQANLFSGFGGGNITLAAGGGTLDTQTHTVATGYALSGPGSLTKTGSGALTLSGANTYSGLTTVSEGSLLVTGSLAGAVDIVSGATLGGSGSINGLATFADGSHLAPGTSPGTITFANGLTLNSGTLIDFELAANTAASDRILVTGGDLTSAGTVTFSFSDVGGFAAGTTYDLIDGTGADLTAFSATHFVGSGIAGYTFNFSLSGSTLQMTATTSAVPEPGTYAAIAGLLVLGFVAYRKRRR